MAETAIVPTEVTNGKKAEEDVPAIIEPAAEELKNENESSRPELTKLESDIIRQIEYYFSDVNMRRDKFLIQKVAESEEGWIPISVLLTFNRLKSLSEDPKVIADALDKSTEGLVQISEDREKFRRHPDNPVPEFNEQKRKEVQARTAYAKGFPLTTNMSELIEYFNSNYEKVQNIIKRKYFCAQSKNYLFKGSVFVTFAEQKLAEEFVKKEGVKYGEKELLRYMQTEYYELKKKETSKSAKKKQAKKDAVALEKREDDLKLPKSAVIYFTGVEGELTREDIKKRISEIEPVLEVSYVHFNKGDKEGKLRFSKENDATKLVEKLEDGKMTLGELELKVAVLTGEEEDKFLEQAVKDMKERRSNFQKGGKNFKGKPSFNRKRRNEHFNDGGPNKKFKA